MIVTKPKWKKHSEYLGVKIFKRVAGTGTSGGAWLVDSCMCRSLKRAQDVAYQIYRLRNANPS